MQVRERERILLVEDEPTIADNVVFALRQEGFDCVWQTTGFEALERLQLERIDLIVLDVGLPDTTGFELCKRIRAESRVPILFLTARSEEVDRIVGLEIGGDDYVCKPFSVRELAARIRVILRRTNGNGEPAPATSSTAHPLIEYGPFAIDESRYAIQLAGRALSLTRYEFRLLRHLLQRRGRVLTREQLMNQVWEDPEASGERTVDAHVKSLRAKLRDIDPEREYIRTRRGIGYSLEW